MDNESYCPECGSGDSEGSMGHAPGCRLTNTWPKPTPPASQESAGEAVSRKLHETIMASAGRELDAAKGIIATLTAELAEARAEVEKETAQSKHLAEAMSRKIQELIAAENQCSYYKGQYTRAEQVRKEACEANVKAQAKTLWLEDELAEAREQRDAAIADAERYRWLKRCAHVIEWYPMDEDGRRTHHRPKLDADIDRAMGVCRESAD